MRKNQAFTLIELLVVIAIIAILASILFPVFTQAKVAAKKTVSMSNMREIGAGMALYLGDYDDTTPALYYYDANNLSLASTQGFYYWPVLMMPYIKSEKIFLCPMDTADDNVLKDSAGRGRFDPNNALHYYILGANPSFGMNYRYLNDKVQGNDPNGTNPTPYYFVGKSSTAISDPSQTVCFGESTMKDKNRPGGGTIVNPIGYSRIEPPSFWTGVAPSATAQGQLWPRFSKNLVNIGWLDSHIRPIAIDKLATPGDVYWSGASQ